LGSGSSIISLCNRSCLFNVGQPASVTGSRLFFWLQALISAFSESG
jgi:hypothetical protein